MTPQEENAILKAEIAEQRKQLQNMLAQVSTLVRQLEHLEARLAADDNQRPTPTPGASVPPADCGAHQPSEPRRTPKIRVLAIANQKGSVGKTTTAINLAACLASAGYRALLVDLSPGAEATTGVGVDAYRVERSIYDLLTSDELSITDVIRDNVRPGLSLLPSSATLWASDMELPFLDQREFRLKRRLDIVRDQYDFALIDCPSWLGWLTLNALTACDGVLLPLQCEYFALEGMQQLLNSIRLVQSRLNPHIQLFGVVLTMYDPRTKLAAEVVDEIAQHFPREKFQTLIPRNVRLSEAPSYGLPITEHDPGSPGALAYKALAEEVIARATWD